MLLLVVTIVIVLPLGWYAWKKLRCFIGTENRHRFFAAYLKDFPVFHNAKTFPMKTKLFEPLHQMRKNFKLLEIGAGSGANFQFYPDVQLLVVDPNPFFKQYLDESLAKHPNVKLVQDIVSGAEDMKDLPDHSVDAVVSTLVQCSVSDMQKVFKEIQRVLVPGGKYYFMEHVIDNHFSLLKLIQLFLSGAGIFPFFFDGCHNDRDVESEMRKAGFAKVEAKRFYLDLKEGLPLAYWPVYTVTPHLYGTATTRN